MDAIRQETLAVLQRNKHIKLESHVMSLLTKADDSALFAYMRDHVASHVTNTSAKQELDVLLQIIEHELAELRRITRQLDVGV
jgi:hypothetical protein